MAQVAKYFFIAAGLSEVFTKLTNHQISKWSMHLLVDTVTVLARAWWRHQMDFFCITGICAGNSTVPGEFPAQKPVTRSFDVFFDLRLNKRLSKQSWGWWSETPPRSLWRQCNGAISIVAYFSKRGWISVKIKYQLNIRNIWSTRPNLVNILFC